MEAADYIAFGLAILLFVTPLPEIAMLRWERFRDRRR